MTRVGLVAAADDRRRRPDPGELLETRRTERERGTASRASATARGCSCAPRRWRSTVSTVVAPDLGHLARSRRRRRSPRPHPRAGPARARPSARAPRRRAGAAGSNAGRDQHERRPRAPVRIEREAQRRVRAHRGAREHGALERQLVEHGREVRGELLVAVGVRRGRRRGAPVAARVVGDDAMARALERARAHHDVAARRREPVQQDDRGAPRRSARRQPRPAGGDAVGSGCWPGASLRRRRPRARARSSAERSGRSQKNRWPTPSRISSCEPGMREAISWPFCDRQQLVLGAVDHERRQLGELGQALVGVVRGAGLQLRHDHDRTATAAAVADLAERRVGRLVGGHRRRDVDLPAGAERALAIARGHRRAELGHHGFRGERAAGAAAVGAAERQRADRARRWFSASSWAIMPPIEMPITCADSIPSASSSPAASSAISADRDRPVQRRARADAAVVVGDHVEVARAAAPGTARPSAARCRSCP